ncbi:hypothetical protein [Geodermatophilus sp. SYSU D00700]
MNPTHTLHATGMKIGHIRGVQPVPVDLAADTRPVVDVLNEAIVTATRRVLPKASDIRVEWTSDQRAQVSIGLSQRINGLTRVNVAHFTLRPVTR